MLGLDPLHVANEGKLVAIVPASVAGAVLAAMRAVPEGADAVEIGRVVADHPSMVTMRTIVGSQRIVDMLVGSSCPASARFPSLDFRAGPIPRFTYPDEARPRPVGSAGPGSQP